MTGKCGFETVGATVECRATPSIVGNRDQAASGGQAGAVYANPVRRPSIT